MANLARCFLPCSCTPLSEALSTPCEEGPFGLISYDHLSRRTEEKTSTTSLALGFLRRLSIIPYLLLPTLAGSDTVPRQYIAPHVTLPQPHSLAHPLQHHFGCLLPLICFSVCSLPAHSAWLDLHPSRLPGRLLSTTALPFAISHLILLPTCSSSY